jgi:protoporphyrinogen/coproporphyrinogen III oxidase
MQSNRKDVVVIGAGISGLVCAYRLKRLGVEVALLEKSPQAGGVMQSDMIDGYLIERGPNSAQGTPELLTLVAELGITDGLVEGKAKAPAYVYFNGRLRVVPMSPPALIKSDLLSLSGKLRLLKEPFISKRDSQEDESVADFISRRLGSEAAERIVAPFVSGIYAGDEKRLSIQAAFPLLANLESGFGSLFRGAIAKLREAKQAKENHEPSNKPKRKRSVSFREGMSFLPLSLAAKLGEDLLTECSTISISECGLQIANSESYRETSDRFIVNFKRSGLEQQLVCKHLIIATPAKIAAALVASISKEISLLVQEIEYSPLSIVYLAYDKSSITNPLDGFGFLAAPSAGLKVLGCLFSSSQFPGRAPNNKALLTIFVGGARNPDAAHFHDDKLISKTHSELQKILGIHDEPQVVSITRWGRAIPQYNLGHAARVKQIEELASKFNGFHIIGNYLHGVSVGDCIKEAERIAFAVSSEKS